MVKRIYKSLFMSGNPSSLDRLVQELVLRKDGHPNWVLTSRESMLLVKQGKKVEDFSDTPEWCNTTDYEPSLYKLMKLNETETPHGKALIIEQAVTDAMLTLKMTAPYKPSYKRGEPERQRVIRYLILTTCKMFAKWGKQPRLHSNLLFALLFNVP